MPPYYFVFFSSLLSIAFEAVMMKVILPLVNNYSQQSVILRWWTTRHQLNTEDIKDNNVSPTAEAIVCNANPIASDVTDIEQRSMNSKDDMIKEPSSSAVEAISGASNIYNNSAEKEDRKLFKHLFTDLQLIAGYCIFVYVIATESSLNTSTLLCIREYYRQVVFFHAIHCQCGFSTGSVCRCVPQLLRVYPHEQNTESISILGLDYQSVCVYHAILLLLGTFATHSEVGCA